MGNEILRRLGGGNRGVKEFIGTNAGEGDGFDVQDFPRKEFYIKPIEEMNAKVEKLRRYLKYHSVPVTQYTHQRDGDTQIDFKQIYNHQGTVVILDTLRKGDKQGFYLEIATKNKKEGQKIIAQLESVFTD